MPRSHRRRTFLSGLGAGLAVAALPVRAAEAVDLQLVLAADVSRSIDEHRFQLQRKGYAAAIADERVVRAMTGGRLKRLALTYCEWSGTGAQRTMVDWAVIDGMASAEDFAARLLAPPRPFAGPTAIGEAVMFAMEEFKRCPFSAERRTIDVSGDGTNNSGMPITGARDIAIEAGVTINGLAILSETPSPWNPQHTHPPGGLDEWYRANVIGGNGSFMLSVMGFDTFAYAMVNKLARETV
ncbi:MAG: DUF1194 domain-containing protein [Proteobacteria bacterium]|nr:DUF1194 domain-containing protein [Pseudomonadota bacterium]